MHHLDDSAAIDVVEGVAGEDQLGHLAECGRCRRVVAGYRTAVEVLRGCAEAREGPPEGLLRWARAYARTAGSPVTLRLRVLSFLAGGAQPVAAVRNGGEPGRAVLYGDEAHHLDLRIDVSQRMGAHVHGQVVPIDEDTGRRWQVCAVTFDGSVHLTATDPEGEFWLDGLESWRWMTVVLEDGDERLVVPRVGGEDDLPEDE